MRQDLAKPIAAVGKEDSPRCGAIQDLVSGLPGGYWRFGIVDHVLTYNIHFPPDRFIDELSQNLRELVSCYPSSQGELAEHLGAMISQESRRLVLGNGTAELIRILIEQNQLRIVVPTPSFDVYEHAALPNRLRRLALRPPAFELDVDEVTREVMRNGLDAAVVISPNNPTSRAVPKSDILHLARSLAARGRKLIIDESFVEFTDEGQTNSIESDLDELSNVIVVKSLGKIYGVCGLRLGYLLSSDLALMKRIRNQIPIWNTNTIGEYFIVNLHRYLGDFRSSCIEVRADRDDLFTRVCKIPGLLTLQPHGNFVFCRIPEQWPGGPRLAEHLLCNHGILLRHCGGKTMDCGIRYLRIAARTPSENQRLVELLQEAAHAFS